MKAAYSRGDVRAGIGNVGQILRGLGARAWKRSGDHVHKGDRKLIKVQ